MSKLSTATTENILSTPFITEYSHVFFNAGTKRFPKESISMEVTNNKDMTNFKNLCEKIEPKTPFNFNKENTKLYVKFGISKGIKVYDENRKLIEKVDIEELLKVKDTRIIFTINKYSMVGLRGISFKAQQMQVRDKENKFKDCFFE